MTRDPKRTANTLRQLANLIENPEAQADLAERAAELARDKLRSGLQGLLDQWMPKPPKDHNQK